MQKVRDRNVHTFMGYLYLMLSYQVSRSTKEERAGWVEESEKVHDYPEVIFSRNIKEDAYMNSESLEEHAQGLHMCELGHFPSQRGVANQTFSSIIPQNKNRKNLAS